MVGGAAAGAGNLISNNSVDGVAIAGAGTNRNLVYGNRIGTDAAGVATLGNGRDGVRVSEGAQYNRIGGNETGQGNLISGNLDNGVGLGSIGTMHNVIAGNRIGIDASGALPSPMP